MNIFVCVKHVPDSAINITILNDKQIDENANHLMNPYDEHALTEAVKIKNEFSGSQVTALCLGRPDAENTVRTAIAMGADHGILIEATNNHDSIFTARLLKAAIEKTGAPDLIFTGKESIDNEGMQTMFRVGALFGFPVATNVSRLDISDNKAMVDSEFSGGIKNTYELSLPCVIGAGRGLNTPKYPTFRDVMLSKKKEIQVISVTDLKVKAPDGKTQIVGLEPMVQKRRPLEIKGDNKTIANTIVDILKNEAKII